MVAREGSRLQLRHPTKSGKAQVAQHTGKVAPPPFLMSILRQAGLTANELRRLL